MTDALHRGGAGSPLLLLHGFTDTRYAWTPVLPALEARHDVLAPTLPGHHGGAPVDPSLPFSMDRFVDALEQMLDDAGVQTAHVAGNSLGGWLALELAARGRARSVIAICPAGGWVHRGRDGRRVLRYFRREAVLAHMTVRQADLIGRRPMLRRIGFFEVVARPAALPPEAAATMLRGAAGCTVMKQALAYGKARGFGDLGPIDCPVRIARGSKDRLIRWPGCFERFATLVPAAEHVDLPGLGHLPMWDDADAVSRTILEVTARVDAAAPTPA